MELDKGVNNLIFFHFDLQKKTYKKKRFQTIFNGFHANILKVLVSPSIFFYEIKIDNNREVALCLWYFILVGKTF